ncbi:putative leucine-rich repeat domain superfamily [Helianthus annuus]|uniref:Leucine-rich repeat domain superfamily n=1 Tax=Helianthus annuus TaxID=4232 RepID=A0A9K3HX02_HELAN|nr:putative leucine-rich repeat domain superfamily [Helianthus annuus]
MNFMSDVLELNNSTTNMSECSEYVWEWLGLSTRGEIPKSLGRMPNIRELHMTYGIGGLLPEFLRNLRSLRVLDSSSNSLVGPLPTFHGKLTHVDLSLNNLNGSVKIITSIKSEPKQLRRSHSDIPWEPYLP